MIYKIYQTSNKLYSWIVGSQLWKRKGTVLSTTSQNRPPHQWCSWPYQLMCFIFSSSYNDFQSNHSSLAWGFSPIPAFYFPNFSVSSLNTINTFSGQELLLYLDSFPAVHLIGSQLSFRPHLKWYHYCSHRLSYHSHHSLVFKSRHLQWE